MMNASVTGTTTAEASASMDEDRASVMDPTASASIESASAPKATFWKSDGWAPIKAEFIRTKAEILAATGPATLKEGTAGTPAEGGDAVSTANGSNKSNESSNNGNNWSNGGNKGKKGKRGRNKKRPKDDRPSQGDTLCHHVAEGRVCNFGERCRFDHDVKAYLERKGPDIGKKCPIWDVRGSCPSGLKCRFGAAHMDPDTLKSITRPGAPDPIEFAYLNDLPRDLQIKLRRNQVPFACDRRGWSAFLASLDKEYGLPPGEESSDTTTAAGSVTRNGDASINGGNNAAAAAAVPAAAAAVPAAAAAVPAAAAAVPAAVAAVPAAAAAVSASAAAAATALSAPAATDETSGTAGSADAAKRSAPSVAGGSDTAKNASINGGNNAVPAAAAAAAPAIPAAAAAVPAAAAAVPASAAAAATALSAPAATDETSGTADSADAAKRSAPSVAGGSDTAKDDGDSGGDGCDPKVKRARVEEDASSSASAPPPSTPSTDVTAAAAAATSTALPAETTVEEQASGAVATGMGSGGEVQEGTNGANSSVATATAAAADAVGSAPAPSAVTATAPAPGKGFVEDGEWARSCLEGAELRQKRRPVDFEGKVYVAPLTTVGNLPFRRVMKGQGADITCGEMAIAHHLLKGGGSEWALLRRHPSEDVFGVQVAGAHPDQMTRVAELLEKHAKVDFVDVNLGCPIDLVCDMGMGAALMRRPRKLRGIIAGMTSQLTCPLTVKMRVGWDEKKPNADVVVRTVQREAERCRKRGFPGSVAHVMIHGRSRLQRYSKLADWDYVRQVAESQDASLRPLPVIGNGDILSWRDHEARLEQAKELQGREAEAEGDGDLVGRSQQRWSTCCMIARGALIKPWLPTEVKEKRDWDISSSERLDIYRDFVNFGLEHWGSDQMGVNKTRRFLLEWLSFTCRYIPVGLLEVLPQRINEKPPPFNGRDDLESLMCSLNPKDWIKICEMLLGPTPKDFEFEPKHKANSYAPQAAATPGSA